MRQLSLLPLSAHARLPAHAGDFVAPYDIHFGEAGKSGAQMDRLTAALTLGPGTAKAIGQAEQRTGLVPWWNHTLLVPCVKLSMPLPTTPIVAS